MALRLRPTVTNTPVKRGFQITINRSEENIDLDELFEKVSRASADSPLVIQVLNEDGRALLETAYGELSTEIGRILTPILGDNSVKQAIDGIINSTLEEYNYTITSENDIKTTYFLDVIKETIAKKIANYLNSLDSIEDDLKGSLTTRLKFNISDDNNIDVNIDYDLDNTVQVPKLLVIYNRLLEKNNESKDLQVGGLALDGRRDIKVKVTTEDYQKYLLGEEKSTSGYTEPGTRKPLIIWTDGTEDATPDTGSDPLSLLDELDYLKSVIKELRNTNTDETLPPIPDSVGEYVLQLKVTAAGTEKSWIRKEDIGRSSIIITENFDGTHSTLIGNSSNEVLPDGTINLIVPWVTTTFLEDGTYGING